MNSERLETAINKVRRVSESLGTDKGPGYLSLDIEDDSSYLSRLRRVGEIRKNIGERTLPGLEKHFDLVLNAHQEGSEEGLGTEDVIQELPEQPKRPIEREEFGNLSRADVSIIASTLIHNQAQIGIFLSETGITPIEPEILNNVINQKREPLIPENLQNGARSEKLAEMRLEAVHRVQKLLANPDFEKIADEIVFKNEDVWQMIVYLSELKQIIGESQGLEDGLAFFEKLILKPVIWEYKIDVRSGTVIGVEIQDARRQPVTASPVERAPIVINDDTPESILRKFFPDTVKGEQEIIEAAEPEALQPEVEETSSFEPEVTDVSKQDLIEPKEETVVQVPVVSLPEVAPDKEPKAPKLKEIEKRDKQVRNRLKEYFQDILERYEFRQPANRVTINTVYKVVKATFMDKVEEGQWVKPVEFGKNKHPKYDSSGVAAILYLSHHDGTHLTNTIRRQVQGIAKEVLLELQKETKKR